MTDLDAEWEAFQNQLTTNNQPNYIDETTEEHEELDIPKCSDIYISTQTKIAYLNSQINLYEVFWKLKVIDYYKPEDGIATTKLLFLIFLLFKIFFSSTKPTQNPAISNLSLE